MGKTAEILKDEREKKYKIRRAHNWQDFQYTLVVNYMGKLPDDSDIQVIYYHELSKLLKDIAQVEGVKENTEMDEEKVEG